MESSLQVDVSDLTEETLLFSTALLDSLAMVELITFVERTSGARFGPEHVTLENLDSLSRILAFVSAAG